MSEEGHQGQHQSHSLVTARHHGHPGEEGAHPPPERPEQAHHQERDGGQLRQGGAGGHLHRGQYNNISCSCTGRKYYIFVVSEAVNFRDTETNCSDNYKWNVIIKSSVIMSQMTDGSRIY